MYHKEVALSLASQGFRVFPLHAATGCDCGKTPGRKPGECNDKAPRWGGWVEEASCDPSWVERSWKRTDYGVAIATGRDFFVLDLDRKGGKDGVASLEALAAGRPCETGLKVISPTGQGEHWYYLTPGDGKRYGSKAGILGPGIDHRGYSGYVVAPGTRTRNGEYRWLSEGSEAPLPAWLGAMVPALKERKERKVSTDGVDFAGLPLQVLTRDMLSSVVPSQGLYDAIARVLEGKSWGVNGSGRRGTMLSLSVYLQGTFGPLDPEPSAEVFRASVDEVNAEGVEVPISVAWVADWLADAARLVDWQEKAEMLRARADYAVTVEALSEPRGTFEEQRAEAESLAAESPSALVRETAKAVAAFDGYVLTLDDLAVHSRKAKTKDAVKAVRAGEAIDKDSLNPLLLALAKEAKKQRKTLDIARSAGLFAVSLPQEEAEAALAAQVSRVAALADRDVLEGESAISRAFGDDRTEPYSKEELQAMAPVDKRWVVGTPAGFFLRGPYGYEGPFGTELVPARARDTLAPASSAFVALTKINETTGARIPRGTPELLQEYGTVPKSMAYVLTGGTRLEGADRFLFQKCQVVGLEPRFDGEIDLWLRALGGRKQETLLDWLATFLRLDRPTACVLFQGERGAGKNLFAEGLATLFEGVGGPVSFPVAVDKFNDSLAKCPVVFADEEIRVPYGSSRSEELKKAIAGTTREVANKNVKGVDLLGALRVIVGVNNEEILKLGQELGPNDVAALDQRVLLLDVGREPVDYLASLGGRAYTERWTSEGIFARHVLWLTENRVPEMLGSRFLVEGDGDFSKALELSSKGSSPVLRALVKAFLAGNCEDVIVCRQNTFWLHKASLAAKWTTLTDIKQPEDLGKALDLICTPGSSKNVKVNGAHPRRCEVKPWLLRPTAVRMGLEDAWDAKIGTATDHED